MTGSGTSSDPFIVATANDLDAVRNNLSAYYIMSADIDISSISSFTPIGDSSNAFTGVFDGKNHTISNLTILYNFSGNWYGLFANVSGATAEVKNLTLESPKITANSTSVVGCVVATLSNGATLDNCHVNNGNLSCNSMAGMVLGQLSCGNISYCDCTNGTVNTGSGGYIGGFSCFLSPATSSTVKNCFSTGITIGDGTQKNLGGFAYSTNNNVIVQDCYANNTIKGQDNMGGFSKSFTGGSGYTPLIQRCYSTSILSFSDTTNVGGFIAMSDTYGTIHDCYFNKDIAGIQTSAVGIGKTTTEMKTQSTYTNFDFTNIWKWNNNNYPTLISHGTPTPPTTTPTYKQDYHNLSSPMLGAFTPLF